MSTQHARLEQDVKNLANLFEEAELPINTASFLFW